MSEPTQTCKLCGDSVIVAPDGRGFPPAIAERKLRKRCAERGCHCEPRYQAGLALGLAAFGEPRVSAEEGTA